MRCRLAQSDSALAFRRFGPLARLRIGAEEHLSTMSRKVVVKQVGDDETRKPTETTPSISAASFRAPAGGVGWSPTDLEGAKDVSNVVLDKSEERHFVYAAAFVCFCCVVTYGPSSPPLVFAPLRTAHTPTHAAPRSLQPQHESSSLLSATCSRALPLASRTRRARRLRAPPTVVHAV